MQQTDLAVLRTFVSVGETGSFSRAAEVLDSTTTAVSRGVSPLGKRPGIRLLNRTPVLWRGAAPACLQRRGTTRAASALGDHVCLHYNNIHLRDEWTLYGPEGVETVAVSGPLSANIVKVLLDAVLWGQGIAVLPEFIAGEALADGCLLPIPGDYRPKRIGLYAAWPSRHFTPTKVRLLVDFLKERLVDAG